MKTPLRDFFFCTFSHSLLPSWLLLYIDFVAFSFSVSPTIGCIQHLTPHMYVAEDQPRCPPRPPLSRSTVFSCPRPPSSVHVTHEFLSVHMNANECEIDIPERDRYARTYVHCENRSLIQSLALMRSAISTTTNSTGWE